MSFNSLSYFVLKREILWLLKNGCYIGGFCLYMRFLLLLSYIANDWFTWVTERLWWWDVSLMLWVNWLMVTISCIFYLILWPIWWWYSLWFWCFFMVYSVLSHLVAPLAFRKPLSWSSTLRRMVSFEYFDLVVLLKIMCYDSYHAITHLPMKFQPNTLSFGLVSKVVTFRLSPVFHIGFYCLKPHGFIWDWAVPSLGVLITHVQVFSSFPCGNPNILVSYCEYWIGSLMGERDKALKLISNGSIQYLSDIWDTLGLHVPILPPIFFPWDSFAPFSFGEKERS